MNCLQKIIQSFNHSNYGKHVFYSHNWIKQRFTKRYFRINQISCVKIYMEHENTIAYSHMENRGYITVFKDLENIITNTNIENQIEDLNSFLQQNWSNQTPEYLCTVFEQLSRFCSQNNICITNTIFDDFIDALTNNVRNLSDHHLKSIFLALNQWPKTPSIKSRNYIEVWAALDDQCLQRMKDWSPDKMLSFVSLTYLLNITKYSDFAYKCLQRFTFKYKNVTAPQLVQTLFYIGVLRRSPVDMHNLEVCMRNLFSEFTIEELAIMAMGFFKSKTSLRDMNLVKDITEKLIHHAGDIHEVSLAALLKLIRYSMRIPSDIIPKLLDALEPQIPRLSIMCCIHVALLGTTTLTLHEPCLKRVCEIVFDNMNKARLKDLERLTFVLGTFQFMPKTNPMFFERLLGELRDPKRDNEITRHGKAFACCVNYLSWLEIYPVDLIDKALSKDFLVNTYGKQFYSCGRETLALHNISDIFHKNSRQNYLDLKIAKVLAKRYTDYVPDEKYKLSFGATDRMILDVMKVLMTQRGSKNYVAGDHILTHHQKCDVIICNDENGSPASVCKFFPSKDFGIVHRPPNQNKWIVLVIVGRNTTIQDINMANGCIISKTKELKALGFYPALVLWTDWVSLKSHEEKCDYLNELIHEASTK